MSKERYDNFHKETEDLKSFRNAAEHELSLLKKELYLNKDETEYLGGYLDSAIDILDSFGKKYSISKGDSEAVGEEEQQWKLFDLEPPDRRKAYASCRWIEGGLSFVPDKIRVCPNCIKGGGTPGLVRFSGGTFSIRKVLQMRKLIILANQSNGFKGCKECLFLEKKLWASKKYLFDIICIAHHTVCNLACEYCHASPEKKQQVSLSSIIPLRTTFEWLIEHKYLSPKSSVLWGGGEPTIAKEFENLFVFLSEYGIRSEVYTNGIILSEAVLKAMKNNLASVMISVDAGTKEVYNAIKGKKFFDKVIQNIGAYVKANQHKVILKMIICDKNRHNIISFLDIAEKNHIKTVCYDVLMYQDHINQEIINAAALFKNESMKRGIEARMGEVGAIYNLTNSIRQRTEESLEHFSQSLSNDNL